MANISIRSQKNTVRVKKRRNMKSGYLFLLLTSIMGILLLFSYIPVRLTNDSLYSKSAVILEKRLNGVNGFILSHPDEPNDSSDVVLIDLKEDWRNLEAILEFNRTVILTGVAPYPAAEVAQLLDDLQVYTGYLEFDERGAYVEEVLQKRKYKSLVFRVHFIKTKEYPNYDIETATTRYIRAIRERSVDAVLFMDGSTDKLKYDELVRTVVDKMVKERLYSETIESPGVPLASSSGLGIATGFLLIASWNMLLALAYVVILIGSPCLSLPVLAVLGKLAIFFIGLRFFRKKNTLLKLSIMLTLSIFLGIAINSQLVTPDYQNRIEVFRGVKLSLMVLPVVVFMVSFLRRSDLRFRKSDVAMIVIFVLGAVYYLLRSGNYSFVLDGERRLRDFLDNWLVVRPRFKELIGYPFLMVAIYRDFKPKSLFGTLIPAIGSIGIASAVNTFCHGPNPLWTQLLRSLYGICFGIIIGMIALGILRLIDKKKKLVDVSKEMNKSFLNEDIV